jgi:hypothetical protein
VRNCCHMLSCRYALLVLVASAVFGRSPGSDLFQHVRPWLPAEIEVAYVSNLPLETLSLYHSLAILADYGSLAALAVVGLDSPEVPASAVTRFKADAAVYVGGRYRLLSPPASLGLQGRFEGCSFLLSSKDSVDAYLRRGKAHAGGPGSSGPYRVGSSKAPGNEVYVSAAEPDLLVICSDRALAQRILTRKKQGTPGVAFAPNNAEWKLINADAPVWGVRRFARVHPDPTSPLGGARGLLPDYGDSLAVAMTFTLESPSLARVAYLTRTQAGNSGYGRTWSIPTTFSAMQDYRIISMQFDPSADTSGEHRLRVMLLLLGVILAV